MMGSSVARSLTSVEIYSASGCRGHPSVTPRLMLTTRRGCNATELFDENGSYAPCSTSHSDVPATKPSSQHLFRKRKLPLADRKVSSILRLCTITCGQKRRVSSRSSDTDCLSRRSRPSGTAPFIAVTISWTDSNFSPPKWSGRQFVNSLASYPFVNSLASYPKILPETCSDHSWHSTSRVRADGSGSGD